MSSSRQRTSVDQGDGPYCSSPCATSLRVHLLPAPPCAPPQPARRKKPPPRERAPRVARRAAAPRALDPLRAAADLRERLVAPRALLCHDDLDVASGGERGGGGRRALLSDPASGSGLARAARRGPQRARALRLQGPNPTGLGGATTHNALPPDRMRGAAVSSFSNPSHRHFITPPPHTLALRRRA